jgi:Protein of unknown function (DUF1579)
MTRRLRSAVFAALLAVSLPLAAGAQPGPEQKKLDALVGRWRVDVETKAVGTTPASSASGTEDCEWFANLHVVCRSEATGAAGLYKAMRTISYIATLKQFASYSVDSLGYAMLSLGQVSGNTWTFSSEAGGYKTRSVVKTSKDAYTATVEYSGPDGKWIPTSTIKATRAK